MFQIGKIVPYAVWSGCTEIVIERTDSRKNRKSGEIYYPPPTLTDIPLSYTIRQGIRGGDCHAT